MTTIEYNVFLQLHLPLSINLSKIDSDQVGGDWWARGGVEHMLPRKTPCGGSRSGAGVMVWEGVEGFFLARSRVKNQETSYDDALGLPNLSDKDIAWAGLSQGKFTKADGAVSKLLSTEHL